jgi:hypothetical protein
LEGSATSRESGRYGVGLSGSEVFSNLRVLSQLWINFRQIRVDFPDFRMTGAQFACKYHAGGFELCCFAAYHRRDAQYGYALNAALCAVTLLAKFKPLSEFAYLKSVINFAVRPARRQECTGA